MRHRQRAACGSFVAAFLMSSMSGLHAQQAFPAPSTFDKRFYFQSDTSSPRIPRSEQVLDRLKQLLISPAEAQIAPPTLAPTQPADEQTVQTSKNTSLRRHKADRPIATGRAAFYEHSGRTASGETYNPDGLTAAHRSLALGTRLRVVNLGNRRSVIVRVTDRAPRNMKFVIDLSRGSARAIGITRRAGTAVVAVYKFDGDERRE